MGNQFVAEYIKAAIINDAFGSVYLEALVKDLEDIYFENNIEFDEVKVRYEIYMLTNDVKFTLLQTKPIDQYLADLWIDFPRTVMLGFRKCNQPHKPLLLTVSQSAIC